MAHSYISYRHENARVNDFDLIALVFLLKEAAPQSDRNTILDDLFSTWIDSIQNDGAGNIDLRLDSLLTLPEHVDVLAATLHRVQDKLSGLPEVLDADFLRQLIDVERVEFGNYKKFFLEKIALTFDQVLKSHGSR